MSLHDNEWDVTSTNDPNADGKRVLDRTKSQPVYWRPSISVRTFGFV